MATATQAIKLNTSQKAELLVFGFVKENSDDTYPKQLIQLIFLWYFVTEQWDKGIKGEAIEIIDDLSIVHTDYSKGCWQGALGINECKSGKHYWKLKITKATECVPYNGITIMVGICEEKYWEKMVNDHSFPNQDMLCFEGGTRILRKYGSRVKSGYGELFKLEGATIKLYLDMDIKRLSYTINDTDYGTGFEGIPDGNYRLAVSICVKRTITLIEYDEKSTD